MILNRSERKSNVRAYREWYIEYTCIERMVFAQERIDVYPTCKEKTKLTFGQNTLETKVFLMNIFVRINVYPETPKVRIFLKIIKS